MNLKPVFQYKPVKTEKLKGGKIVPGEFEGAFRTKVAPGTPGSKHHTGENAAGKNGISTLSMCSEFPALCAGSTAVLLIMVPQ